MVFAKGHAPYHPARPPYAPPVRTAFTIPSTPTLESMSESDRARVLEIFENEYSALKLTPEPERVRLATHAAELEAARLDGRIAKLGSRKWQRTGEKPSNWGGSRPRPNPTNCAELLEAISLHSPYSIQEPRGIKLACLALRELKIKVIVISRMLGITPGKAKGEIESPRYESNRWAVGPAKELAAKLPPVRF